MPLLRPRHLLSLLLTLFITLTLLPTPSNPSTSILTHTTGLKPPSPNFGSLVPERFKWRQWGWAMWGLEDELVAGGDGEGVGEEAAGEGGKVVEEVEELPKMSSDGLTWHPNGYLLVQTPSAGTPLPKHPILSLIARAETRWSQKLEKNSKTLEACVAEYRRRYKRAPPFGFEKWWKFAVDNKVILKDEYDQIYKDTMPFLALEPKDLAHRVWVMANERAESFTLTVLDGEVKVSGSEGHLERASDLAETIGRFGGLMKGMGMGDVNMTFTKHDQPAIQMIYARKMKMWDMAAMGEYFSPSDYVRPPAKGLTNWANACPTNSALYLNETSQPSPLSTLSPLHPHSFIYSHSPAMDPCQHPESKHLHGFTAAPGTDNGELVPLFTFAKTGTQSDVLVTPLEQYSSTYIGDDPEWGLKKFAKLLWRGSTTGAEFRQDVKWQDSQRARLHFLTHETEGEREVLVGKSGGVGEGVERKKVKEMNERWMETALSGGPVQCDEVTCRKMKEMIQFAPTMGLDDSYQYKYLMDVDGNGWSGRFHRLMSTKSLVLKSTIFPEWYLDRVEPWVHYVPIKVDYTDLYDVMSFFIGSTPDQSHDELAAKIAAAGKQWAGEHWRREDMAAYMFRLVLEWRRILYRGTGEQLDYAL